MSTSSQGRRRTPFGYPRCPNTAAARTGSSEYSIPLRFSTKPARSHASTAAESAASTATINSSSTAFRSSTSSRARASGFVNCTQSRQRASGRTHPAMRASSAPPLTERQQSSPSCSTRATSATTRSYARERAPIGAFRGHAGDSIAASKRAQPPRRLLFRFTLRGRFGGLVVASLRRRVSSNA